MFYFVNPKKLQANFPLTLFYLLVRSHFYFGKLFIVFIENHWFLSNEILRSI